MADVDADVVIDGSEDTVAGRRSVEVEIDIASFGNGSVATDESAAPIDLPLEDDTDASEIATDGILVAGSRAP